MKKTTIAFLLLMSAFSAEAQNNVGLFFNQSMSTFRFKDSDGNVEDLDYTIKYGYGLTFSRAFGENLFAEGSLAYNIKGAQSTIEEQKLDWTLHYLNLSVNGGYRFNFGRISPLAGAGLYYGRLLKADQYIGTVYYDLLAGGEIRKNDIGFNLFAGIEYDYSDNGSVFLRLNETVGLYNLEEGEEVSQKMYNRTFSIYIGLSFIIK